MIVTLLASSGFLLAAPTSAVRAQASGPFSAWWQISLIGNTYVGNTVTFDFTFYNTNSNDPTDTLTRFLLDTPWQIYTDPNLPASVCFGRAYAYVFNVTIPSTEPTGLIAWGIGFTGNYSDGSAFCASTSDVCVDAGKVTIIADPSALQSQVTSLQQNQTRLSGQVSSLNGQLSAADANITTLSGEISSYKGQVSSLQGQVSTDESKLASVQSQLNEYAPVYIPLLIVVAVVIAAVMGALYLRKGRKAAPTLPAAV